MNQPGNEGLTREPFGPEQGRPAGAACSLVNRVVQLLAEFAAAQVSSPAGNRADVIPQPVGTRCCSRAIRVLKH